MAGSPSPPESSERSSRSKSVGPTRHVARSPCVTVTPASRSAARRCGRAPRCESARPGPNRSRGREPHRPSPDSSWSPRRRSCRTTAHPDHHGAGSRAVADPIGPDHAQHQAYEDRRREHADPAPADPSFDNDGKIIAVRSIRGIEKLVPVAVVLARLLGRLVGPEYARHRSANQRRIRCSVRVRNRSGCQLHDIREIRQPIDPVDRPRESKLEQDERPAPRAVEPEALDLGIELIQPIVLE